MPSSLFTSLDIQETQACPRKEGVSVDDLDAACKRFDDMQVNWKKRLTDGRMKNVAFVLDPDNYWVEVIQNEKLKDRANW